MADNSILTRLDGLKLKYEEIGQKLTDPEVIADVKQFIQFNKEYREPVSYTHLRLLRGRGVHTRTNAPALRTRGQCGGLALVLQTYSAVSH